MGVTGCAEIFMRLSIMFVCSTSLCRGFMGQEDQRSRVFKESSSLRTCSSLAARVCTHRRSEIVFATRCVASRSMVELLVDVDMASPILCDPDV